MFAQLDPDAAAVEERSRNTPAGLASSLRLAGTGTQEPLWDRLPGLGMPVLVVTGAADEKFTGLGHRMARAIGTNASAVAVPEAGHAPHLERPSEVARLVRRFAAGTE
jgi:pimeloyl-ACP methyl ester carboxylesterase